ncbi:MAG: MobF family relaxase [Acidimicrobiales bacterium]
MGKPLKVGGTAWQYLVDNVAGGLGEGAKAPSYYAGHGTPPGKFLGKGLVGLGGEPGAVKAGDAVSPEMLYRMLVLLADPLTGEPLGRPPAIGLKAPVAGYDLTFTVPKSLSLMWAMGDEATRAGIEGVLERSVAEVLGWAEDRQVFCTRTGAQGARQEPVVGVVASTWLHYESRDGDPHIHIHAVAFNKAQTASDGSWRALDGREVHQWLVAMSERHTGIVEDLMAERFGVAWYETKAMAGRVAKREIDGVAPDIVAAFSRRTMAIEEALAEKARVAEAERGRELTKRQLGVLHGHAWRETRQKKAYRPLAEMTAEWAERARPWVGDGPSGWSAGLAGRSNLRALQADDIAEAMLSDVARAALAARAEGQSVFTEANLAADVERELHGVVFAPGERAKAAGRAAELAVSMAVKVTPPELAHVPERFRAPDRTSQFAPASSWKFTTTEVLEAEARLLDAGRDTSGPKVSRAAVTAACEQPLPGNTYTLGADQALAVEQVATSGRVADLVVGAAGTGKSVALGALRSAWEAEYGPGSVKGLAPSASAAATLAEELGIATENTAKWLFEAGKEPERMAEATRLRALAGELASRASLVVTERAAGLEAEVERWGLHAGDLLVVDEAGLASTLDLDRLAAQAGEAGAKLLLVGDWAQQGAVGPGGAFSMLVDDRGDPPELVEARRFREAWERAASTGLRRGLPAAIDEYLRHGRALAGNRDEVLVGCYEGWRADAEAGKTSIMIAQDNETVGELNRLARAGRVAAGEVAGDGVVLADGSVAGAGDVVAARKNDRKLRLPDGGWVRNRDRFVITATNEDGSMAVRPLDGEGKVVLPAPYVAEHVELGYATTTFSSQGKTVTIGHAVVGASMAREALYVAATRGRESNKLYVDVEPELPGAEASHGDPERLSARQVLISVAHRRGAEASAHQTLAAEWASAESLGQLVAEHESLVAVANSERWEEELGRAGISAPVIDAARRSPEWDGLVRTLASAEELGLPVTVALSRLVALVTEEDDPAAFLHTTISRWGELMNAPRPRPREMVAGLVPRARAIEDEDLFVAIREREELITRRARELAEEAVQSGKSWARPFGPPPENPVVAEAWWERLGVIAAYRERWRVVGPRILGDDEGPGSLQQAAHKAWARRAGQEAAVLAGVIAPQAAAPSPWSIPAVQAEPEIEL